MSAPEKYRVLGAEILLKYAHEHLPVDEQRVSLAMSPYFSPDWLNTEEVSSTIVALLRTAGYFVIDLTEEEWRTVFRDSVFSEIPESEEFEFPPLPFPRIWIEIHDRDLDQPITIAGLGDSEKQELDSAFMALGIIEKIPGELWDIYLPVFLSETAMRETGYPSGVFVLGFPITPRGLLESVNDALNFEPEYQRKLISMAVNLAHWITATNISKTEVVLPRTQRKTFTKKYKYSTAPSVYYIDIDKSGEKEITPGKSGRHLHVRFLVAGHWRQYSTKVGKDGRQWTGKKVWVKSFIKGPVGSPWKGRPVHRVRDTAA